MSREERERERPTKRVVVTCALTGVLTDPAVHPVPVTPREMAREAKRAHDAGASVMHVHFRSQEEGKGRAPTWDPAVAEAVVGSIRAVCPEVVINMSTGVIGPDVDGPVLCLRHLEPEIAACNAGSLNYLKTREDGEWAWPPILFDNPVEKIRAMLEAMEAAGTRPEFECFDVGIVRSVGLFVENGMVPAAPPPLVNFVMGVASGMPADAQLLGLLPRFLREAGVPDVHWQLTAIGREGIWDVHRRAAELGGHLRTGLEDTFYLPGGDKAESNGELVEALVAIARDAGREPASPQEARQMLGLGGA